MKNLIYSTLIIFLFQGCNMPGDGERTMYKFFNFNSFYIDNNDSIVLEYQYNFSDDEKYIKLNSSNSKWEETSKNTVSTISLENISFINGETIVKDENGTIIFRLTPPTIQEIENTTGISLPNSMAYYNVFKSGKEYKWDRTTYIVNIGIEKAKRDNNSDSYTFTEVHCFSLVFDDINASWSIVYIGKRPDVVYEDDLNLYSNNQHIKFIDGNISLCHNWAVTKDERCFIKNSDSALELKKLYGDIVPIEYQDILNNLYNSDAFRSPSPSLYFFDNNLSMHIFYNDVKNAKGDYFKYRMYKKENPTTPLYEQKIAWD